VRYIYRAVPEEEESADSIRLREKTDSFSLSLSLSLSNREFTQLSFSASAQPRSATREWNLRWAETRADAFLLSWPFLVRAVKV